jgi:phosphoenolpyruvate carboxykinase (GTP)
LLAVDVEQVREEMPQVHEHLGRFGDHLPAPIKAQLEALEERLSA